MSQYAYVSVDNNSSTAYIILAGSLLEESIQSRSEL